MLNFSGLSQASSSSNTVIYDEGLRNYMLKVYNHMGISLLITAIISFIIANSATAVQFIYGSTAMYYVTLFAPLGFLIFFNLKIRTMSSSQAVMCLWIFAALMAISLAPIFLLYTGASIARAFFVTASLFGFMSLYGYTTKKDLTSMGSFLRMGLFGIIIAVLLNIFFKSNVMSLAISVISVIIFTGLTAYDSQRIKETYASVAGNAESLEKVAVMGAVSLYMNFVNLFIAILRLFGERR